MRSPLQAYTTALELSPSLLPVLANRGACYLALGELVRCVEDSEALLAALDREAMGVDANPNDEAKNSLRLKGLLRRGTARCQQVPCLFGLRASSASIRWQAADLFVSPAVRVRASTPLR